MKVDDTTANKALSLDDLAIPTEWERAMDWFNDGDPSVLAELIIRGEVIPTPMREFVADIVSGKRRPPTVGKARQILSADHKKHLQVRAQLRALLGSAMTPSEGRDIKARTIAEVVALSGVPVGTVMQAWKKENSPYAQQARKNKALKLAWKKKRDSRDHIEKLREISKKNDPFNGAR